MLAITSVAYGHPEIIGGTVLKLAGRYAVFSDKDDIIIKMLITVLKLKNKFTFGKLYSKLFQIIFFL